MFAGVISTHVVSTHVVIAHVVNAHVVNTHKVVTSMMAMIAHDAYENTTYAADPIVCVDCEKKWGWKDCHQTRWGRVPIESFGCCQKQV